MEADIKKRCVDSRATRYMKSRTDLGKRANRFMTAAPDLGHEIVGDKVFVFDDGYSHWSPMTSRQALRDFAYRIDDTAVINPETDRRARKLGRCRTGQQRFSLGGAPSVRNRLPAGVQICTNCLCNGTAARAFPLSNAKARR